MATRRYTRRSNNNERFFMQRITRLTALFATAAALAACGTTGNGNRPAPAQGRSAKGGVRPGMDAQGNVIDSKLIESGSGREVTGLNGQAGEIVGNPAPKSKFTRLQIGMPMRQVTDLIGQPTDQGAYVTGKAWIPFYFGNDRYRHEFVYEKTGRLVFAGSGADGTSPLIWIIHNRNEPRYR